jgi:hypothetical protein
MRSRNPHKPSSTQVGDPAISLLFVLGFYPCRELPVDDVYQNKTKQNKTTVLKQSKSWLGAITAACGKTVTLAKRSLVLSNSTVLLHSLIYIFVYINIHCGDFPSIFYYTMKGFKSTKKFIFWLCKIWCPSWFYQSIMISEIVVAQYQELHSVSLWDWGEAYAHMWTYGTAGWWKNI